MENLLKIWQQAYQIVPAQLEKMREVRRVATAFNTNIDAVLKISGVQLAELAHRVGLLPEDLKNPSTKLSTPKDVVRGIIKCFCLGIAEEWLCEDKLVYDWMRDNLGYDRMQMGGQAGIIANVLAVTGVQNVLVHTSSHPMQQAALFLDLKNLLAVDADGVARKACEINRAADEPLIHWIIEFDAEDTFELSGIKYTCPKANRFIATYDAANTKLKINTGFLDYLEGSGFDYLILSGFHCLTSENGGLARILAAVPLIEKWKRQNPKAIIHLEMASTQDKAVRLAIAEHLAPAVDSVGLNEREALDVLEVIAPEMFAALKKKKMTAPILFDVLHTLKERLKTPRIQLHFFGMYLTLQNKGFVIGPEVGKRGMMLAATIAASKAGVGDIESREHLLWAHGRSVSEKSVAELRELAAYFAAPELLESGMMTCGDMDLIAVPTILVENPKTLVGMGDTISAVSLVGAR